MLHPQKTARCRYLLRVTVARNAGGHVVKDFPFFVRNFSEPQETEDPAAPIKVATYHCAVFIGMKAEE